MIEFPPNKKYNPSTKKCVKTCEKRKIRDKLFKCLKECPPDKVLTNIVKIKYLYQQKILELFLILFHME